MHWGWGAAVGYIIYLSFAIGGRAAGAGHGGRHRDVPALLLLVCVHYALTSMHARTGEQATLRSIVLKLENERLVTELRAESRRALAAQEAAEQADRDKSRFLAAASHDLRQPLHAMGLFRRRCSAARSTHTSKRCSHAHAGIRGRRRNAHHLARLLAPGSRCGEGAPGGVFRAIAVHVAGAGFGVQADASA